MNTFAHMKQKPRAQDGGVVSVRVDGSIKQRLQELADADYRTVAQTVRRLLIKALAMEGHRAGRK